MANKTKVNFLQYIMAVIKLHISCTVDSVSQHYKNSTKSVGLVHGGPHHHLTEN